MRIDLTCPVELWHCRMPTAQDPVLTMEIYNLSDKEVSSVQLCVLCYDAQGEQYARQVERLMGLDAPARHAFEASMQAQDAVAAQEMEVVIEKVWFGDNTVWRRGANPPAEYAPSPLLKGTQLEVLQELAGHDASSYPSDQGRVWVCVCGRPNAAKEEECARCHRDKHDIFTQFNQAAVEKIIFERQSAQEEEQRRAREEALRAAQEKEKKQKKRRHIRRIILGTLSALLVLGGLFYGVYFHAIPYYHYYLASRALDNSQYENAKDRFLALDDYRDSAQMALECDYRAALSALNGGTYTSLRAAQSGFDALADYKDSQALAKEARYIYAEKRFAAGEYENALAYYEMIPAYKDADEKIPQAQYQWAESLMETGDYDAARQKFLALGDYSNAPSSALECLYRPGAQALEKGEALKAAEYFAQLPGYRDSDVQLQKAYYTAANQYFDDENYTAAAEYYLLAGDYSDAYRRAAGCLYAPAVSAMEDGRWAEAAEMLQKIAGYQDAKERLNQCILNQGLEKMEAGEYEAALAFFDQVPDLPEAQEARRECTYRPAMQLLEEGQEDEALALLITIPGYRDADAILHTLRSAKAQAYLDSGDFESALPLLTEMRGDEGGEEALKSARYGYAAALLDRGEYENALKELMDLGDYENSAEYRDKARFLMALDFKAQGDYEQAVPLLEGIKDYPGADDEYADCVTLIAQAKAAEGKPEEAAQMLFALPQNKSVQALAQEYAYQAGQTALNQGWLADAARLFGLAGDYADAKALSESIADQYYREAYATAQAAFQAGDDQTVVEALAAFAGDDVSEKYADIPDMYRESCYRLANRLYEEKKPFEAYAYYRQILDYKDVSTRKLNKTVYKLMGAWETESGFTAVFREDGTCRIGDKEYFYTAATYALRLGESTEKMENLYNVSSISEKKLTLLENKTNTYYRFKRAETP